jgi:hypothetical protein
MFYKVPADATDAADASATKAMSSSGRSSAASLSGQEGDEEDGRSDDETSDEEAREGSGEKSEGGNSAADTLERESEGAVGGERRSAEESSRGASESADDSASRGALVRPRFNSSASAASLSGLGGDSAVALDAILKHADVMATFHRAEARHHADAALAWVALGEAIRGGGMDIASVLLALPSMRLGDASALGPKATPVIEPRQVERRDGGGDVGPARGADGEKSMSVAERDAVKRRNAALVWEQEGEGCVVFVKGVVKAASVNKIVELLMTTLRGGLSSPLQSDTSRC